MSITKSVKSNLSLSPHSQMTSRTAAGEHAQLALHSTEGCGISMERAQSGKLRINFVFSK
jgi:hypothetical protein